MTPALNVDPENDVFGDDVLTKYTLTTNPDGVTSPLLTSPWTHGALALPEGLLTDGTQYYWTATIAGHSGGGSAAVTRSTDIWTFLASHAADVESDAITAEDDQNAPDDTGSVSTFASTNGPDSGDWGISFADGQVIPSSTIAPSPQAKAAAVREYHDITRECPTSAKAGHVVENLSRAGAKGAPGHKAHLSCGKGSLYYNHAGVRGDYGWRHIAGKHGRDFDRPIKAYPQAMNGASWSALARVSLDHTLDYPTKTSYVSKSNNYNYVGPLNIIYKGDVVHTYIITVAISNGNWAVVTEYCT